jgi:hypothetical protein
MSHLFSNIVLVNDMYIKLHAGVKISYFIINGYNSYPYFELA